MDSHTVFFTVAPQVQHISVAGVVVLPKVFLAGLVDIGQTGPPDFSLGLIINFNDWLDDVGHFGIFCYFWLYTIRR